MSASRRFAEGTTVSVAKSREELETLLARAGAAQIQITRDTKTGRALVVFRLADRMIRLEVKEGEEQPNPSKQDYHNSVKCPRGWNSWATKRRQEWVGAQVEQQEREQWRRLLLVVKAKLELAHDGGSTVEREFLADILLPNGSTVHKALVDGLRSSYTDGQMPLLLPAPSDAKAGGK